jgi:signal transduction histidine kinase
MSIDWPSKARHALLTAVFGLTVAGLQWAFAPHRLLAPLVIYSLAIALITWVVIDLGRHAFPSARETGWPMGWKGIALIGLGIVLGYVVGNALGDVICRHLGLYRGTPPADLQAEVRRGLLVTLVAGVVGTYVFYSRAKSAHLLRQMAQARSQATEAQLKLLQSQLEPHMLFNTLANLRALIPADPQRAVAMLDHLNAFLRATLDASRATQHPLSTEFQRLGDYLDIMAVRMGPRLRHRLELPAELAVCPVPTLLLQPLVENAIRHGLEPQVAGGELVVRARRDDKHLCLEVQDSGAGVAPDAPAGFGLTQVRERLHSAYGEAAGLAVGAAPGGGTLIRIHLPCPT